VETTGTGEKRPILLMASTVTNFNDLDTIHVRASVMNFDYLTLMNVSTPAWSLAIQYEWDLPIPDDIWDIPDHIPWSKWVRVGPTGNIYLAGYIQWIQNQQTTFFVAKLFDTAAAKQKSLSTCMTGSYLFNTPGMSNCARCSEGYFNPLNGGTSFKYCSPCDQGYFNTFEGVGQIPHYCYQCTNDNSTSGLILNNCTLCTETNPYDRQFCFPCPVGTFNPFNGSAGCEPCPASNIPAAITCPTTDGGDGDGGSKKTGLIVGLTIGGVVFLAALAGGLYFIYRRRQGSYTILDDL